MIKLKVFDNQKMDTENLNFFDSLFIVVNFVLNTDCRKHDCIKLSYLNNFYKIIIHRLDMLFHK